MTQLFANNAYGSLGSTLSNSATSLTLGTGQGGRFPSPTGGDHFTLTLIGVDSNGSENIWEIVKVTGRSGDVLTIVRAQENTSAAIWPSGSRVELRMTAAGADNLLQKTGGTMSGDLTFIGTTCRIFGDFSNATPSNRLLVQSSTVNGTTLFGIMPNGTSVNAQLQVYNSSDPNNTSIAALVASSSQVRIVSGQIGTGVINPITFIFGSTEAARLVPTTYNFLIGTTTDDGVNKLQVNGGGAFAGVASASRFMPTGAPSSTEAGMSLYSSGAFINTPTGTTGYLAVAGSSVAAWSSTGISLTGALNATGTVQSGNGATTAALIANGAAAGVSGGSAVLAQAGGITTAAIGNYSNLIGGSYDGTATVYGNGDLRVYAGGGTRATFSSTGLSLAGSVSATGNAGIGGAGATLPGLNIGAQYGGVNLAGGGGSYANWGGAYGIWPWNNVGLGIGSSASIGFVVNNGTEAGRFDSGGNFLVGTTGGSWHIIQKTSSSNVLQVFNASTATGSSCLELNTSTVGDTTGYLIKAGDGSAYRFYVNCVGNVTNYNNSYGAISDVKLKENITDATPKLAGLMQVRIVNYNLKTDPEHKQIGVIAQELEQVFPGLVEETPDYIKVTKTREVTKTVPVMRQEEQVVVTSSISVVAGKAVETTTTETKFVDVPVVDVYPVFDSTGTPVMVVDQPEVAAVLDENGEVVTPRRPATYKQAKHEVPRTQTVTELETYTEREATGEVTKSVKYSVFVPMLIKAMQEQNAMVESLTTRIIALEAA